MAQTLHPDQPTSLPNVTCPYCGVRLEKGTRTRDHVIGKNFVPRGALDASWNLILKACGPCNVRKSDFEDDISAITLLPDLAGPGHDDPAVGREAERKARGSISRVTRKPVKESVERGKFEGSFGPGMTFSFGMVAPPQIDDDRIFELARLHVLAFFYLLTYDERKREGWSPPGVFFPANAARKSDWGNPIQRAFAVTTQSWPIRIAAVTAGGYFSFIIRRNMPDDCWSFAFEWNRNLRAIGFFGDEECARRLYEALPELEMVEVARNERVVTRIRKEIPLPEDEDTLFFFSEGEEK